jgi:hypothetical protein
LLFIAVRTLHSVQFLGRTVELHAISHGDPKGNQEGHEKNIKKSEFVHVLVLISGEEFLITNSVYGRCGDRGGWDPPSRIKEQASLPALFL